MSKKEPKGTRAKRKAVPRGRPSAGARSSVSQRAPITWQERYDDREPVEVLLAAAARFGAQPDEVSGTVAASLRAVARALTTKRHHLIVDEKKGLAAWVRRARKEMPDLVLLSGPSRGDRAAVARGLVRLVSEILGSSRSYAALTDAIDEGLALQIAGYLHRMRDAFDDVVSLEDWPLDEHPADAAKKVDDALRKHGRRFNRCDPEIVAKVCLKARGLSEDDAKNVVNVAMSSVR